MGRAGAATPTKKKDKDAVASAEDKADELESKRLRDRAFSQGLLSRTKSIPVGPLRASKTILKSDGRDIVKKGQRKTKYLFAFPGLMAPVAGGKVGELSNLDSKNPILYIDFPQGRMKLFGTIVYPKNKYLTLHFARGAGSIVCEDCFESLVVFSAAWWIGKKDENPEEVRLDWPKDLEQDKLAGFDFTAGAGRETDQNTTGQQNEKDDPRARVPLSPLSRPAKPKLEHSESENTGEDAEAEMSSQPVRQSARTAGRKLRYAASSSENEEDDGEDTDSSESQQDLKSKKKMETPKEGSNKLEKPTGANATIILDSDGDTPKRKNAGRSAAQRNLSTKLETMTTPVLKDSLTAPVSEGSLTGKPSSSRVPAKVLKQSKMENFSQKPALQETVTHEDSTPRKNKKGSADLLMESSKDLKRPRKSPHKRKEEDSGSSESEDDSDVEVTPSKGKKRIKNDESASARKGGSVKGQSATPSKGKTSKDGKLKQQIHRKPKKSVPGSTSEGKKSGKKSAGSKSKMGSDSEAELSDSVEQSDDSDEDWMG